MREAPLDAGGREAVGLAVDDGRASDGDAQVIGLDAPFGRHCEWTEWFQER